MGLLMGLIYFYHYKYAQPAVFYLKAPILLYAFLFIALRALRFEARFVIVTGLAAVAGWVLPILPSPSGPRGPPTLAPPFCGKPPADALPFLTPAPKTHPLLLAPLPLTD